jgi:RNA polymerase sigma factor (sigma-70 family)
MRNPDPAGERADHRANDPHEVLAESERREALARCLDGLEPEERAVFRGRMGNQGYDQIATRLSLTVKRAYKLLDQAKAKLRGCLERAG